MPRTTRVTVTAALAGLLIAGAGACSGSDDNPSDSKAKPESSAAAEPSTQPSAETSAAEKAPGIPPEPDAVTRAQLLRALAAANPDIVKYEDKAVDAARNQCGAINGGAKKLNWTAAQRFTYKDVTTTEAQGKQINEALTQLHFCQA
ncbi:MULTISPECIES: hypothetical protein [unclassified Streptomyces]|uniref:hypothetical protein n=1 Tax=unclassified Streptomyces TaxID=2593676 RepID=UPI0019D427A2|nr:MULTISPECIES: hypothetical protein [unclassified Streptomyces]